MQSKGAKKACGGFRYHGLRMSNSMTYPIKYYFRCAILESIGELFLFLPKLGNDWDQISELCLFSLIFPFGADIMLQPFGSSRNSDWSLNFDSEFYENYFSCCKNSDRNFCSNHVQATDVYGEVVVWYTSVVQAEFSHRTLLYCNEMQLRKILRVSSFQFILWFKEIVTNRKLLKRSAALNG